MEKTGKKQKIDFFKNYWQEIVLGVSAFIYFIYFTVASFLRYTNFYTGRFDLGNMAQTVWNTLHGNLFMLTDPNGTEEITRLAFHADFILILLTPLYLLWEDPRMLLLIQTLILSIGGVFVYLIGNQILKNKTLSLVFAICFYLNPAVNYTNLYDFHAVTLATTFLLAAFYFILRKNWVLTLLFIFLAGITKEQVWAVNALLGFFIIFVSKQKLLGTIITLFSACAFFFLFWVAIPKNLGSHHFALEFYSDFGTSPTEIMKNIILNPLDVTKTLISENRLIYLKQLFMPLGYLSFFAFPILIFAAPDLMINLLSNNSQMHQIYYQYSAVVTPFIFIAAIYASSFILKKLPEVPYQAICIILLIMTLASAYTYGPLPFARKPNDAMFKKPLPNRTIIDSYLKSIPEDSTVSASNSLGSHLSHRNQIYVVPNGFDHADTVLFLLENPSRQEEINFSSIVNNPDFRLIFRDSNFYVFKRSARFN